MKHSDINTTDLVSKVLIWGKGNAHIPHFIRQSCDRKFTRRFCRINFGKAAKATTVNGCLLNLIIGDYIDNEVAIKGVFETHITKLICELAENSEGSFIDAGCHIGYYSTLVGKIKPSCNIVAIDANPIMAERCKENLKLNNIKGEVLNVGIGSEHATLNFRVSSNLPSLGTFGSSPLSKENLNEMEINIVPFSDILNQTKGSIFLIKMDVEGFEYFALSSLDKSKVSRVENIIFEFSEERLKQCSLRKNVFNEIEWIKCFDIFLLAVDGQIKRLDSLLMVPDGDQNIWLKRR